MEAMTELIKRGDKRAHEVVRAFVSKIAALKNHTHDRAGYGSEHMEAAEMCELIVKLRLRAAEPALRLAYTNKCEKIRRPVSGALAALGDRDALHDLRQFARQGDALRRSDSIKMLALVGDKASLPALREMLGDREPWVREAAKEAIVRFGGEDRWAPYNKRRREEEIGRGGRARRSKVADSSRWWSSCSRSAVDGRFWRLARAWR